MAIVWRKWHGRSGACPAFCYAALLGRKLIAVTTQATVCWGDGPMSDTVTTHDQPMEDAPAAANGPPAAAAGGAGASDGAAVAQPMAVGDSESAAGGGASDEHAVWSDVFKMCGDRTLAKCAMVSSSFKAMSEHNVVWNPLCNRKFPFQADTQFPASSSRKAIYKRMIVEGRPHTMHSTLPATLRSHGPFEYDYIPPANRPAGGGLPVAVLHTSDPWPVTANVCYFEVEIVDAGQQCRISVGVVPPDYNTARQVGWDAFSYGYHGDDGKLFHDAGHGIGWDENHPWPSGTVIGCGLLRRQRKIFFTKNGEILGVGFQNVRCVQLNAADSHPHDRLLYPAFGLHSPGERVRIVLGYEPSDFRFDLTQLTNTDDPQIDGPLQPPEGFDTDSEFDDDDIDDDGFDEDSDDLDIDDFSMGEEDSMDWGDDNYYDDGDPFNEGYEGHDDEQDQYDEEEKAQDHGQAAKAQVVAGGSGLHEDAPEEGWDDGYVEGDWHDQDDPFGDAADDGSWQEGGQWGEDNYDDPPEEGHEAYQATARNEMDDYIEQQQAQDEQERQEQERQEEYEQERQEEIRRLWDEEDYIEAHGDEYPGDAFGEDWDGVDD
ncbi:unnamed protein product [Vitrella brassicaformis CCMP3155]|uniref:B30.2/SPRY domain-containing protein n=1 Tax=Vitrella brassicaformis (strain CCMP3155) TaxID=1169540 RepID=A0A0G4FFU1_VITBC|nr:unnamed protein product [Vitrella brassicaformis CCMP3155]|eukprot:CEM12055.1 unnamed protein product [Vitrella brassicaformis CCMP3155]